MTRFQFSLKSLLPRVLLHATAAVGIGQVGLASADGNSALAVYTSTNGKAGNEIVAYQRGSDGALTLQGKVATNGLGTGGGLGNQGALALTKNGRWLFAVNAGSNEISAFAVRTSGLVLVDKVPSGGQQPVSLTLHDDLLYVLNAGGINNITGFSIGESGKLTPIENSTKPLSGTATGPAQVQFDPEGEVLVVTEKATNKIDLYAVEDGVADGPLVRDSNGTTPFGFAFDRNGHLIVSEAFGGGANKSALSSYNLFEGKALQVISGSVGTQQTAACWVVVTRNNRYAYTTNTGSGTVSGYRVTHGGALSLLNADGRTAVIGAGSAPTDAALSRNSQFLYVLNSAIGTVSGFRVEPDGSLSPAGTIGGLAAGVTGLVAR